MVTNSNSYFIEKLKNAHLKATPQRIEIFKYLYYTKEHPNIDTIYSYIKQNYPTISLATVYNTVEKLNEAGYLVSLNLNEGFSRYDGNTDEHIHFYCTQCKKVVDVHKKFSEILNIKHISQLRNSTINSINIVLNGTCEKCSNSI